MQPTEVMKKKAMRRMVKDLINNTSGENWRVEIEFSNVLCEKQFEVVSTDNIKDIVDFREEVFKALTAKGVRMEEMRIFVNDRLLHHILGEKRHRKFVKSL